MQSIFEGSAHAKIRLKFGSTAMVGHAIFYRGPGLPVLAVAPIKDCVFALVGIYRYEN